MEVKDQKKRVFLLESNTPTLTKVNLDLTYFSYPS